MVNYLVASFGAIIIKDKRVNGGGGVIVPDKSVDGGGIVLVPDDKPASTTNSFADDMTLAAIVLIGMIALGGIFKVMYKRNNDDK